MKRIATLTLNPAIDASYEVDRMFPTHKMRSYGERYDPGGGGINVARVIAELGGMVRACYAAGGPTGIAFDALLDAEALPRRRIGIAGATRLSATVRERASGQEYRIVPRGPTLDDREWRAVLALVDEVQCDLLVASGSLPDGVPTDFYRHAAKRAAARGIDFILDSSGAGLRDALDDDSIMLIKPSGGELRALVGQPLESEREIVAAARGLVARGAARNIAVTLGHEGAILITQTAAFRLPALSVPVSSAVGAGDSFLGAMAFALAQNRPIIDAFRLGVAAGGAAVISPGTRLCSAHDIERLSAQVPDPTLLPADP